MADTIRTKIDEKEFFDSAEELDCKVTLLADLIKKSDHFIVFTGAGISTSTGIADYRSGINTVLETGPGLWVKQDAEQKGIKMDKKPQKEVNIMKAYPSFTHFALNELERQGHLKYIISQNVDGLHRKSGFPMDKLAELHGNYNIEYCRECKIRYWRDYKTRISGSKTHETKRNCSICKSILYDTIIAFGDDLDDTVLQTAMNNGKISDLCLVLGSSLTVNPASSIPTMVFDKSINKKNDGHLAICNLQGTHLDIYSNQSNLRMYEQCDKMMSLLMKKLGYNVSTQFIYDRFICIDISFIDNNNDGNNDEEEEEEKKIDDSLRKIVLSCMDNNGTKSSFLTKIIVKFNNEQEIIIDGDDMISRHQFGFNIKYWDSSDDQVNITLSFIDNYGEKDLKIALHEYLMYGQPGTFVMKMSYNAYHKKWIVPKLKEIESDQVCKKLLQMKMSEKLSQKSQKPNI